MRLRVPLGARVLTDWDYGVVAADLSATYRVRLEGWGGSVYIPAPAPLLQRRSGFAGSARASKVKVSRRKSNVSRK